MEGQVILLALLIASPPIFISPTHLLIYEVSPYPYSGTNLEYVCLLNPTSQRISLDGYTLTDFEGNISLRGAIPPGGKFYIAQNSSAFFSYFGFYPNMTYSSKFALANSGDEVALYRGGEMVDLVVYGNSKYKSSEFKGEPPHVSQGHVLRRRNLEDTDSAEDWTNYHRIAQSDFHPSKFRASLEVFEFPDNWREVMRFVNSSKREVLIEAYTLDSEEFINTLLDKMREGVEVRILLEGSPVGGISQAEKVAVHRLWLAGASIDFMVSDEERRVYNRYTYIHSKFIIVDGEKALVSTENFGHSSMKDTGNRGYGVIVRNRDFAQYLRRIFLDDSKPVVDIKPYQGEFANASYNPQRKLRFREEIFKPENFTALVTPIVSPDFSETAFWNFIDSQRTLWVEALYIDGEVWGKIENKTEVAITGDGSHGTLKFQGKYDGINYLHAKLIVGENASFVGSMNFGRYSMERNREVSLLIEGEDVSDYFLRVISYDSKLGDRGFLVVDRDLSGNTLNLNFQRSLRIERVRVLLDGREIYYGSPEEINLKLDPGIHRVHVDAWDYNGNSWSVGFEISVEREYPWRAVVSSLLIAVFLYKLWKGREV